MKTIFTTLFIADAFLLMLLAFSLFNLIDAGTNSDELFFTLIGIFVSICLLIIFLGQYLKAPKNDIRKK